MVILSKNNPSVKAFSALKEKKGRQESGLFLVEGEKMVRECIVSGLKIDRLAVREDYKGDVFGLPHTVLGKDAFQGACDEKTPQGIIAAVKIPHYELRAPQKPCLYLENVADPANVGAIIRTANAAGYEEIYLSDCADPYSPKSVRASMSGVFYPRLMIASAEEILTALSGVPLIVADMGGENVFRFAPPEKFALLIGNEGRGVSERAKDSAAHVLKIPMGAHTESLNAAVSAGILMYLLKKKNFESIEII